MITWAICWFNVRLQVTSGGLILMAIFTDLAIVAIICNCFGKH